MPGSDPEGTAAAADEPVGDIFQLRVQGRLATSRETREDLLHTQEQILELFGEEQAMIDEVILQESSWFRGILKRAKADAPAAHDAGLREGHDLGLREGEVRGRREMIEAFLAKRFAELGGLPEIQFLGRESARAALLDLFEAQDAAARGIIKRYAAKKA